MSDIAIRVQNLGKEYRLGQRESYQTLRDSLTRLAQWPFRKTDSPSAATTFWALRDVSFDIAQGEVVGVIGRNGAGKSTLLKILSQITEPTTGRVELHGRVGSLLEVGTGFHPELTGRENIYLNGAILGMKRTEIARKFDEIVAFAEIEKFLDTPVKHYSSGMYMRLAFAVAAHLEPEILVVDEVLAVGDAEFQKKCLGKMQDVSRQGRTVVFVSHQMSMIEALCDTAILLDQGQIERQGDVEDIVGRYLASRNTQTGEQDLSTVPRVGTGAVRLKSFWVEDDQGRRTQSVRSGETIALAFQFESQAPAASRVSFGFSLHAANEQMVALVYSDYQGISFSALPRSGVARFRIPKLCLSNGTYYVGARVLVNGIEADWPREFVGILNVEGGDYYGVGQPFHSGIGPLLLDGEWDSNSRVESN